MIVNIVTLIVLLLEIFLLQSSLLKVVEIKS